MAESKKRRKGKLPGRFEIRVSPQMLEALERLVESGQFSSISEAAREAIKQLLAENKKE